MTDLEAKCLAHIAMNPQDFIENAVRHQIDIARDELVALEKQRMIKDPSITHMPSDPNTIIAQANIISAAERQAQGQ